MTDAKYCKDRIKEWGICVPIADLEAIIAKDKEQVDQTIAGAETVESAVETISENSDPAFKDKIVIVKNKMKEGKGPCKKSLQKLNAGKLCVLVSGQAGKFATWNGTEIVLNVDTTSVG